MDTVADCTLSDVCIAQLRAVFHLTRGHVKVLKIYVIRQICTVYYLPKWNQTMEKHIRKVQLGILGPP